MAVESDFTASLVENLKLEDPWLPPSSWESIPSESGSLRMLHASHSTSSNQPASETSLVRLSMNALEGVQSALISMDKISAAFCSDPADRTFHQIRSLWNRSSSTHAQGKMLKSIGRSGFLVFLLRGFVDYFTNLDLGMRQHGSPCSLVNRAFSVAVGKVMEGYMCALDTLYASLHLRHSSNTAEMPSKVGCLNTVVHSQITLLELYLHTKELTTQIEAVGNICNLHTIASCFSESSLEDLIAKAMVEFSSFFRGGDLLSYLYGQLKVADPPHQAVLKFLFLRSFEPYGVFIRSWIYKAEISDPHKEFVVEYVENVPQERAGVAIPCFLRDSLIPLVRAGQQLQVLMKLLELCTCVGSNEDLLPCWSLFSDAFPITFKKGDIEARGIYYKRMHEKLQSLMKKLEFRYQQVVSNDTVPKGFGDGWRSSDVQVSFKLDNNVMAPSAEDKMELNVATDQTDSDESSTVNDISYVVNTYESSECSSNNSEERILSEQLSDLSSDMTGLEQKYLSALSFSVSSNFRASLGKPFECGEQLHIDSNLDGICETRDMLDCYEQSQYNGTHLNQISFAVKLQERNLSCMSVNQYRGHLPDKDWSVKNLLIDGSCGGNLRSNVLDCDPKVIKMGALKEGMSYYRKMIVMNYAFLEELSSNDQHENNIHSSDLITSHNNFLSINPMLMKHTFLKLQMGPGERYRTRCAQSFPYFDFSSVEDPSKGCLQNFSADFMDSDASPTRINSDLHDKQHCDQDSLIDKPKALDVNSVSEVKDYNQEDATSTGGNSWESLLGRSSNTIFNGVEDHRASLLGKFDMPLDFIIDKCLLQEIMLQYKYVSKLTIKLLEEGFYFKEHLLALRRYHFMLADWADLFIMSLWHHKWCITEAEQRLAEIQGFLELSIQRSSCECDHNKDRLYVYTKGSDTMPLSASAIGLHSFDFLGLGYRVDWPVSIVLTSGALKIYSEIFSFLIKVKLAIFSLTDIWCSLKELKLLISLNQKAELDEQKVAHFNLLVKMRHQVNHFVSMLQQYVESQLSHVSWCRFLDSLQHKVKDMMDLESVHMAYLTDSLHICFLSGETRPVARIIDSILQCALDFRSCLRRGMWDVGINQDLAGSLSRINKSQVLAIKKTFEKNIQELHLYYFKSPKNGEYGLSRFWGYLNFNEYYSDVGNGVMQYYAFSI